MKIRHSMNTETFRHKSLLMFKDKVEKETEGRVVVELYPSGQLGTEMEPLEPGFPELYPKEPLNKNRSSVQQVNLDSRIRFPGTFYLIFMLYGHLLCIF